LRVLGIGPGPAALDVMHAEGVERPGDLELVLDGEGKAFPLGTIAQGRVVNRDSHCQSGAKDGNEPAPRIREAAWGCYRKHSDQRSRPPPPDGSRICRMMLRGRGFMRMSESLCSLSVSSIGR